ncbi:acyl carrier protein [Cephaloticoccus primus]|uniref:acyl carrier protein n=1 Tax=Cephaloticoccus primus TaxID=1548207 RepID=UPI0009EE3A5F|nr:acyl carrier protein [Cephaloticoccus primus]
MYTYDQIFTTLRSALVELFKIAPERIIPQSNLYTDLEIDSIDAIDLIDHIQRTTGQKLEASDFRTVRTVEDVIQALLKKQQGTSLPAQDTGTHLDTPTTPPAT